MARSRRELQAHLESLLGTRNVYFKSPSGYQLSYPCIIYSLEDIEAKHANNVPYRLEHRYLVTYISKDPDDPFVDVLASLRKCTLSRAYTADGLLHTAFALYY